MIILLVTAVVELEFSLHCTDTLPSMAVSSSQPRSMLPPSTDVLKYKLVKGCNLVPFFRDFTFSEMFHCAKNIQVTCRENRNNVEHR